MSIALGEVPQSAQAARVEVACDACGSAKHRVRYPLRYGAIVECADCGFCFVSPRLASSWLQEKLQQWAQQDVVDDERLRIAFDEQTLKLYDAYLRRLARHSGIGSLLDVGCATGALLSAARQQGWRGHGLEIGEASAAYARDRLKLDVTRGSLYDVDYANGSWDAISLLEVIEHLESPTAALERLARWLRPGGALLISTPNFDSLYRRLFGSRWWVVNCEDEHIMFFTPRSLRRALRKAGLRPVWTRIRGADLSGMWRLLRSASAASATATAPDGVGYRESRAGKERIKSHLRRLGLLGAARSSLTLLDHLYSMPLSPLHGWGEQIVMIAVKQ